jgi:hypothetical protein
MNTGPGEPDAPAQQREGLVPREQGHETPDARLLGAEFLPPQPGELGHPLGSLVPW